MHVLTPLYRVCVCSLIYHVIDYITFYMDKLYSIASCAYYKGYDIVRLLLKLRTGLVGAAERTH